MINQVVLTGRLVDGPILEETENGKKNTTITLAVSRNYKNLNGEYEIDFIPIKLFYQISESICEYCEKGDLVGVRGRISRLSNNDMQIIGEKVSFLSSRRKVEKNNYE